MKDVPFRERKRAAIILYDNVPLRLSLYIQYDGKQEMKFPLIGIISNSYELNSPCVIIESEVNSHPCTLLVNNLLFGNYFFLGEYNE